MASPTMIDEENGIKTMYWSCPIRFIPNSIFEFVKRYKFHEQHPSAFFPAFENVSPRYLQAERILHLELSKMREVS